MKQRHFISRFTPSRTKPEDLEAIFVQRHSLLDDTVGRVRESALTKNKHHILFVGPRGCGKTHLTTLLNHRLENLPELNDKLRIAWLNEDETSTSFLDLLVRIYRALTKRYAEEFPSEPLDKLYGTDEAETIQRAGDLLLKQLGKRCLLVLIENLDEIFKALDDKGQKSLRAFIQDHSVFTIVATAQRLFDGVVKREAPFFGFFQTEHLETLSVEGAAQLLINIAELNNDAELASFLRSHKGKSRVRALHHLSGGNHRIYIILSEFITRDSVEQLVRPFEEMVDELTPYYQERLRWLAPLQRKIVEFLCACEG
ncbi:MAG: tetratricopeptide repeat protein, partial [Verrucomicrobiales bacterium]|nr:tetratricopeptide repeat protein [Verrucomicrobiales bacterium]